MPSVLFVCTANICRSPMAEALLKARRADFGAGADEAFQQVASAGARAAPRGGPIDARAAAALQRANLSLGKKWRSQRIAPEHFERYELILAMEADNLAVLREQCPPALQSRLHLLLDFAPGLEGQDVPDPYFGPAAGFDHVLALQERAVAGLAQQWRQGRL